MIYCRRINWTVLSVLLVAVVAPSSGVTVDSQFANSDTTFDANANATDLVNSGQPTLSGVTTSVNPNFGFAGLNDGVAATNTTNSAFYRDNRQPSLITFTLDTSTNTNGYNIESIRTIAGWAGVNVTQANQKYEVSFSQVDSLSFQSLGVFENAPFSASSNAGASTQISLTDDSGTIATNVDVVRLNLIYPGLTGNNSNPGTVYREIDIEGAAASAGLGTNLIQNGSFENPVVNNFQRFDTANPFDGNWAINPVGGAPDGEVTLVRGTFGTVASEGAQWLSLESNNGNTTPENVATISQAVATEADRQYVLSFDYNALGRNGVNSDWELIYDFGQGATTLFIPNPAQLVLGEWMREEIIFTATGGITTFNFTGESKANGFFGTAIDNVRLVLVPVPEPTTAALGLLGVAGLLKRRRKVA